MTMTRLSRRAVAGLGLAVLALYAARIGGRCPRSVIVRDAAANRRIDAMKATLGQEVGEADIAIVAGPG